MLNIDRLNEEERWLDLRDRMGKLWAKYDPLSHTLEMRRGDVTVRFALGGNGTQAEQRAQPEQRTQAIREVEGGVCTRGPAC